MRYKYAKLQRIDHREWTMADYVNLTHGGRFYFLRPRSLKARAKWYALKMPDLLCWLAGSREEI